MFLARYLKVNSGTGKSRLTRRDLPLHPSAIVFDNVFSFSKELDQETLRICIFLGKDCVKLNNLLKLL